LLKEGNQSSAIAIDVAFAILANAGVRFLCVTNPAVEVPQQYYGALLLESDDIGLEKVKRRVAGVLGCPARRLAGHIHAGEQERQGLVTAAINA
jgi:hypothetical protein